MQRGRSWGAALPVVAGLLLLVITTHIAYVGMRSYQKMDRGKALAASAEPFSRMSSDGAQAIVIVGDSLAYGVGASSPERSLAGQLSERFPEASVVNEAEIGVTTDELEDSIAGKLDGNYDSAFIVVGGNDIVRHGVDLDETINSLRSIAELASGQVEEVYLVTSGDFANVSILPWFLRPFYSERSRRVRDAALAIDGSLGNVHYADMFGVDPDRYARMEAEDGFHLNDSGIRYLLDAALARRAHTAD